MKNVVSLECMIWMATMLHHQFTTDCLRYSIVDRKAVSDTFGPRKVDLLKGMGLVNEVFNQENIASLKGNIGVGHCRYSTAGESIPSNAQPLVINYVKGKG